MKMEIRESVLKKLFLVWPFQPSYFYFTYNSNRFNQILRPWGDSHLRQRKDWKHKNSSQGKNKYQVLTTKLKRHHSLGPVSPYLRPQELHTYGIAPSRMSFQENIVNVQYHMLKEARKRVIFFKAFDMLNFLNEQTLCHYSE